MLVENLYNGMLNNRFIELIQKPEAPFLMAYSSKGLFIRSKEFYGLTALVKEEGIERGLEALFLESERVARFGFTQSELDRQKADILRAVERAYTERVNTRSSMLADEYVRHFLQGEPIPGIEYEFELHKRFVPEIELEEINRVGKEWITDHNRVVMANVPEKEGFQVPTEEDLLAVMDSVAEKEIAAYEDAVSNVPLLAEIPEPGEIVRRDNITESEITEWTLSNGIRVILKPTEHKKKRFFSGQPVRVAIPWQVMKTLLQSSPQPRLSEREDWVSSQRSNWGRCCPGRWLMPELTSETSQKD